MDLKLLCIGYMLVLTELFDDSEDWIFYTLLKQVPTTLFAECLACPAHNPEVPVSPE